jgi:benzoylformate decarboxylase
VILAGQELARHEAFAEAAELAERLGAPVFADSVPYSASFPTEHPAYMGALSRQQKQVRSLLEPYDLLICLGADLLRMSVYSPVEPLPEGLPVIHVSERAHELGKNYRTDLAVHANVKETLKALLPMLKDLPRENPKRTKKKKNNWSAQREKARPWSCPCATTASIDPQYWRCASPRRCPATRSSSTRV